jgi:hypothetical protein
MDVKTRIEQLLSEILSDKYECKVTLHFERRDQSEERKEAHVVTETADAAVGTESH